MIGVVPKRVPRRKGLDDQSIRRLGFGQVTTEKKTGKGEKEGHTLKPLQVRAGQLLDLDTNGQIE